MPTLDADFIGFSSRKTGKIVLDQAENVTAARVEIVEPILELTVYAHDFTPEEIEVGELEIPEIECGDIYMAHMAEYDALYAFPETLRMTVNVKYDSAEGEQEITQVLEDSAEQGWALNYWDDEEEATEWSYPGFFRFSTYESLIPISIVLDAPEQAMTTPERIVLSVSLSINGRKITADECEITETEEDDPLAEFLYPDEEPKHYYYAHLMLKRPEWAETHGIIHLEVAQQLSEDGSLWTSQQDIAY